MPTTYFNSLDQVTVQPTQTAILQTIMRQARREALALLKIKRMIEAAPVGTVNVSTWRLMKQFWRTHGVYEDAKIELLKLAAARPANVIVDQDYADLEKRYGPIIASDVYKRLPKVA